MIADAGLVGFPNAGKSTLLSRLSRATPEIAAVPVHDQAPEPRHRHRSATPAFVLADLPGLIEGAAQGVGLGHEFLRHVERTRVLIHLVEPFPIGRLRPGEELPRDPQGAAPTTSSRSTDKPEVVCVSKAELTGAEEVQAKLAADLGREVLLISAVTGQGLSTLVGRVVADARRDQARRGRGGGANEADRVRDRSRDPHRGLPTRRRTPEGQP